LDGILEISPVQGESVTQTILIYRHDSDDVKQVAEHTPGSGLSQVLHKQEMQRRDRVAGNQAFDHLTLDQL